MRAVDFSRRSYARTRRINDVRADQTMFNELRRALILGARLARSPRHLYARQLLGCLDEAGRANLFRVGAMSLRHGHQMFLEFSAAAEDAPPPDPAHLVKRLDPRQVAMEVEASGGRIDYVQTAEGVDMFDNPDPVVCRMRITWPHPKES